jgi:hypothetical protein
MKSFWESVITNPFYKKGGGTPNPFTVGLMPFFRGVIPKACFFCKLLQDISKKGFGRRRQKLAVDLG